MSKPMDWDLVGGATIMIGMNCVAASSLRFEQYCMRRTICLVCMRVHVSVFAVHYQSDTFLIV